MLFYDYFLLLVIMFCVIILIKLFIFFLNKRDIVVIDGIRVLNYWKVVNIIKYNFFFFENLLVIEIKGVEYLFFFYCLYGIGSY